MILSIITQVLLQAGTVGKDIALPLPVPEWLLIVVLIIMFLIHLVFVNLMFGGTLLTLIYEILGKKKMEYHALSQIIANTITVNKSLAVVMGVAPLLAINTLYTKFFYTANALTGLVWIMVVPLLIIAFLLLYLHKYTYNHFDEKRNIHIGILIVPMAIFLFIPLIFLTNINLMLFPDKWSVVSGFWDALFLPTVFSRYFHFINASLALTGLYLFWHVGRKSYFTDGKFSSTVNQQLKKQFYQITFYASIAQFVIGPIILLTLPTAGIKTNTLFIIIGGALIAIVPTFYLWKEITGDISLIGKYFALISISMFVIVVLMGSGRHVYRANALEPYRIAMKKNTEGYAAELKKAQKDVLIISGDQQTGKALFESKCMMCHSTNKNLIGPSLKEVVSLYKGNQSGMINWIKEPGKKRPNSSQMPSFKGQMSQKELEALTNFILNDAVH